MILFNSSESHDDIIDSPSSGSSGCSGSVEPKMRTLSRTLPQRFSSDFFCAFPTGSTMTTIPHAAKPGGQNRTMLLCSKAAEVRLRCQRGWTLTCSKGNLRHRPHRSGSAPSQHFPGRLEHISSSQDQTPTGDDPTAPAAFKHLSSFGHWSIVFSRRYLRCC